MLFWAAGAPRPFLKHRLGPAHSGVVRAGLPEGRRRASGEHGAMAPAAGCHPGPEGLWPLLPDGEVQIALCAWSCCTLPLALAAVLPSVGRGSLPVFCDFAHCSFLRCHLFSGRERESLWGVYHKSRSWFARLALFFLLPLFHLMLPVQSQMCGAGFLPLLSPVRFLCPSLCGSLSPG